MNYYLKSIVHNAYKHLTIPGKNSRYLTSFIKFQVCPVYFLMSNSNFFKDLRIFGNHAFVKSFVTTLTFKNIRKNLSKNYILNRFKHYI